MSRCDERWSTYATYAQLRLDGLRDDALKAATRTAAELNENQCETEFVEWICTEVLAERVARSVVIPHPLEAIVLHELWRASDRGEPFAIAALVRWFPKEVMASRAYEFDAIGAYLGEAVERTQLPAVIDLFANHQLNWVRINLADVPNGRYDGDPAADLRRLDATDALVMNDDPRRREAQELRDEILAWLKRRT